ncbi:hypothetical protein AMECASPLE_038804 [Ameca splendens]|uniref:Uncharacterized protein n=1 Tax=Ameca splendens TaxID=208324 RepID=A0ABV0ZT79_9TELE
MTQNIRRIRVRCERTITVAGRAAMNVTDRVEEEELSAPPWTGLILAVMKVCFTVGNVTSVVNIQKNGKTNKKNKNKFLCMNRTANRKTRAKLPDLGNWSYSVIKDLSKVRCFRIVW